MFSICPYIVAVSAQAPLGSTTAFRLVKQVAITSTVSASVTVTTWSSLRWGGRLLTAEA
ncbi:hypothetical protein [Nonomuraea deserti]|uniref:hypothetical protein n=1 Tax=Nonomuraea deserti TaxID=1848322 RepID=UPI001404FC0B|nr:hypothetical protein [Nonomuraea deserti]